MDEAGIEDRQALRGKCRLGLLEGHGSQVRNGNADEHADGYLYLVADDDVDVGRRHLGCHDVPESAGCGDLSGLTDDQDESQVRDRLACFGFGHPDQIGEGERLGTL